MGCYGGAPQLMVIMRCKDVNTYKTASKTAPFYCSNSIPRQLMERCTLTKLWSINVLEKFIGDLRTKVVE